MSNPWIVALIALFAWWFSTGAILAVVKWADRGSKDAHRWVLILAAPMLFLGVALFADTHHRTEVGAIYAAFFAALMIWGWIEMAFLCGVITGPNRLETPAGVPEWERFVRATGAIAYHELLLLSTLLCMGVLALESANPFGLWTFSVLFAARISAKLNLFYGVPRINTDFLPLPLKHLPTHFRRRRMNAVFPVSVLGLSLALWCFVTRVIEAATDIDTVGFALLAAITALALLEHLLMVIPLPDDKLWRWMLPASDAAPQSETHTTR